jgi:hypothetical protein
MLEYALSWAIQAHSKVLNVYNIEEKVNNFSKIYENGITVPQPALIKYLNNYQNYIEWSDTYFNIQSYFNYDIDIHNIEDFILNLDFMKGSSKNRWGDMFGQDFTSWNTCHRMLPNLLLSNDTPESNKTINFLKQESAIESWECLRGPDWPNTISEYTLNKGSFPLAIQQEITGMFNGSAIKKVTEQQYNFLDKNFETYANTKLQITKLVNDGFLVTGIPLKLQSLKEKRSIIKNFDQCVRWYNEWVQQTGFGNMYADIDLEKIIVQEEEKLNLAISQQNLLQ